MAMPSWAVICSKCSARKQLPLSMLCCHNHYVPGLAEAVGANHFSDQTGHITTAYMELSQSNRL